MTQQYSRFMRWTSRMVILSMLAIGLPLQPAFAGMVDTNQVASHQLAGQNRDRINTFLDREDVLAQLQMQGVTIGEAKARVNALSDDESNKIAGKLDRLPAGGGPIGDILSFLMGLFIILLITDIAGLTKVFSFTKPL